jgi:hypothetical protein
MIVIDRSDREVRLHENKFLYNTTYNARSGNEVTRRVSVASLRAKKRPTPQRHWSAFSDLIGQLLRSDWSTFSALIGRLLRDLIDQCRQVHLLRILPYIIPAGVLPSHCPTVPHSPPSFSPTFLASSAREIPPTDKSSRECHAFSSYATRLPLRSACLLKARLHPCSLNVDPIRNTLSLLLNFLLSTQWRERACQMLDSTHARSMSIPSAIPYLSS